MELQEPEPYLEPSKGYHPDTVGGDDSVSKRGVSPLYEPPDPGSRKRYFLWTLIAVVLFVAAWCVVAYGSPREDFAHVILVGVGGIILLALVFK